MNKLENTGLIGGVSPLKQVVKAKRSGRYAKEATGTTKQRGGHSTVTSSTNRGGYNVNTRFKPENDWNKPPSGGTKSPPEKKKKEEEKSQNPKKPYSYTPEGELKINDPTSQSQSQSQSQKKSGYWKEWTTEHEYDKSTSYDYKSVWDRNDKDFQKKWKEQEADGDGGYAAWEKSAKKWNKDNPGESKKRQSKNKGKYTKSHKEWIPEEEGTQTQTQTQSQSQEKEDDEEN